MRKQKAGKKGEVAKYISRAKAIRKLQVSLKDFRKLCILKGIYPREPPKKLKQHNRSYYHLKDVNFLALDPLIEKIRSQRVYLRKYKKAKAKGDVGQIKYLVRHKPKLSMNHLVRERYPDFTDALRDLDDPLSLMALFTIFPTHKEFNLSGDKINAATQLLRHFQLYVIRSHSLKKAFVSIKGIYYQCEIMGQTITYVVPYKYPPSLPLDVDYRVMSTFLDFYLVLLKFINFKLYASVGLEYPPICQTQSYQGYQIQKVNPTSLEDSKYQIDQEFQSKKHSNDLLLFENLHFYLSTETPRDSLEYIILAFGGTVQKENNGEVITHVITDRQNTKKEKLKEYVQPQWVYDCINFQKLLNVKEYEVGQVLPPHVSPFSQGSNSADLYVPQRERELRGMQLQPEKVHPTQNLEDEPYDVIAEKKKLVHKKIQDVKDFAQISKNVMSNKNRKLLRNIEKGLNEKKEAANKLRAKSQKSKA